ncbi:hypothetical protein B0H13DRAFT_1626897 [Mycena leptocephala]|nr:hypothetical protein B0H13DRAFT_1626897 [Mycena leptocephala]
MFSQTFLAFVLASLAVVKAVDLCAYSNTLGCSGTSVCCGDIAANLCCHPIPAGFGFSIDYLGLPGPVSDGQAWTGTNCVSGPIFTDQIGTGNKCFVGAGTKINSMAWTNSASKGAADAVGGTMQPNVFKFTVEGVEKSIQIPAVEGAIDTILTMYKAGNFTGIEAYAHVN